MHAAAITAFADAAMIFLLSPFSRHTVTVADATTPPSASRVQ